MCRHNFTHKVYVSAEYFNLSSRMSLYAVFMRFSPTDTMEPRYHSPHTPGLNKRSRTHSVFIHSSPLIAAFCPGALCGQLCGETDSLQPPADGHLCAADASDDAAPDGRDGEQGRRKREGSGGSCKRGASCHRGPTSI